jgi:hypothetical protein
MHDLIFAAVFAAMILIPCILVCIGGETNEEEV